VKHECKKDLALSSRSGTVVLRKLDSDVKMRFKASFDCIFPLILLGVGKTTNCKAFFSSTYDDQKGHMTSLHQPTFQFEELDSRIMERKKCKER
jgi:hypothetical protein